MEKGSNYDDFVKNNPNYLPVIDFEFNYSWNGILDNPEKIKNINNFGFLSFACINTGMLDELIELEESHKILENSGLVYFMKGDFTSAKDKAYSKLVKEDAFMERMDVLHEYVFYSMFVKNGSELEYSLERIQNQDKYISIAKQDNLNKKIEIIIKNSGYSYNNHSLTLLINNKIDKALEASNESINYESYNPFAHYVRSIILWELDKKEEALHEHELAENPQKYFHNHNCINALNSSKVIEIPEELIIDVNLLDYVNNNHVPSLILKNLRKREIIKY